MENVKCVVDNRSLLGEGVIWIPEEKAVLWVDILGEKLHKYWPLTNKVETINASPNISAVIPTALSSDIYLTTFADGVKLLEKGIFFPIINTEPGKPGNRCNDAFADHFGNLWFGTMDSDIKKRDGYYYCLRKDGTVNKFEDSYMVTNGPVFDAKNNYIYLSISEERKILRGSIDAHGDISDLELWLTFDESQGLPDGMTIDSENYVWVSHWSGSRVSRFSPDGKLDREIFVPAKNVTKCAFGGEDLSTLYITTASEGCSKEDLKKYPKSGSLFAVRLEDVKGVAPYKFDLSQELYKKFTTSV